MEQISFTYDRELEVNGGSNADQTLAPVRSDTDRRVWSVYLIKQIAFGATGRWRGHVTGR